MKPITPHLWFDKEAKEASEFYVSLFPDSKITHISQIKDTPSGDCDIVSFELSGQPFMAISAGPVFKINPSISFILNFDPSQKSDAREQLDATWEKLIEGGTALMPLDTYPFSPRFGWVQDRFGVSWQLMLTDPNGEPRPFIIPHLLFVGDVVGRAEEAMDFYCSVFKDGKRGTAVKYPAGREPDKEGTLMFGDFYINGTWMSAMDSAHEHKFAFNEGVSLMVSCDTQEEIDYYWEKLSKVPEAEQCGWLKDQFGVSWQITATAMNEMMEKGTPEQVARVTQAFMPMKKFDIATLQKAFDGE